MSHATWETNRCGCIFLYERIFFLSYYVMGLSLSSASRQTAGPFYVKNDNIYIITLCIFLRNVLHKTPSKSDEK